MFIQRKNELSFLEKSFKQPSSSLNFIFGARNCGKTALLNEYSKEKKRIYFSNYEMIPSQFFTQFADKINNHFFNSDVNFTFNSFLEVLVFLEKQKIKEKLVLIIDDFQNILKVDKNALSDLYKFWKKKLKYKNIQLIISSAILFDEDTLNDMKKINSEILYLEFLDFTAIKEFFPAMNKIDQLYLYSLLGTTPTNLKYYNPKIDFADNIYNLFLNPNSYLFDYGIKILKNEISDIGTYSSILYAISKGNTKIGDIAGFLNVKSTYLTRYIQKLIDMMILKKVVPLGEHKNKTKFGRYEMQSNALKFWYCFIYPNLSSLQLGEVIEVKKQIEEDFIKHTVFYTYKTCIKEFIYKSQKDIFSYKPINIDSWWDNNSNYIDLVAYDSKTITFVQILWEDKKFAKISYEKLKKMSKKYETTLDKKYIIITKDTFLNMK